MMIELVRSIFSSGRRRRWSVPILAGIGLGLVVGTVYAGTPLSALPSVGGAAADEAAATDAAATHAPAPVAELAELEELETRIRDVTRAWAEAQDYYDRRVAPIERVLRSYRDDPELAERVAVALVREANQIGLEPRLLLAVLLVENPWLDPEIRSPVGAIGLMQVMPLHRGAWPDCGDDLEDIDANICYGSRIFAHYFRTSGGNIERALLRYNGCVRGTNTPDCHQYPYHVFARAGRASVLAWLGGGTGVAAGSR